MENNYSFFDRLMKIVKDHNFKSLNEFALKGLHYDSSEKLNRLKNPAKSPSFEILKNISNKYENINMNWLITGNGNPYQSDPTNLNTVKESPVYYATNREKTGKLIQTPFEREVSTSIDFYDIDFTSELTEQIFNQNQTGIKPAYQLDIPEFSGKIAFRVFSNSMEPLIQSGDIVFSQQISMPFAEVEYGQIYVIITADNRRYLKYIKKARGKESDTHYLLVSENKQFDSFLIEKKRITALWLIEGWLTKRV